MLRLPGAFDRVGSPRVHLWERPVRLSRQRLDEVVRGRLGRVSQHHPGGGQGYRGRRSQEPHCCGLAKGGASSRVELVSCWRRLPTGSIIVERRVEGTPCALRSDPAEAGRRGKGGRSGFLGGSEPLSANFPARLGASHAMWGRADRPVQGQPNNPERRRAGLDIGSIKKPCGCV